jgi:hypothetical protein
MKNKIIFFTISTVFILIEIINAKSQYSWSEKFKAEMGTDWVVFDEQKNSADLIYPWTFFNPLINRLGLIEKSSIKKLSDGIFKYK